MCGGDRRRALLCCLLVKLCGMLFASSSQLPLPSSVPGTGGETILLTSFSLGSAACRVAHRCNFTAAEEAALENDVMQLYPRIAPRGCSCQDGCELFDACCADMIPVGVNRKRRRRMPRHAYSCSAWLGKATGDTCDSLGSGLVVIHRCPGQGGERLTPPLSSNADVSAKCAFPINSSLQRTDVLATPVTDLETGATYRNVHCATCWNVPPSQIVSWQWRLSCADAPPPERSFQPVLRDRNETDASTTTEPQWQLQFALFLRDKCTQALEPPPGVLSRLHRCQPDLTDSCSQHHDGTTTKNSNAASAARACERDPAAIVYSQSRNGSRSVAYRNAHCARCRALAGEVGFGGDDDFTCEPTAAGSSHWPCLGLSKIVLSQSFTVLLSRGGSSDATDMCPLEPLWVSSYGKSLAYREQCFRAMRCALGDTSAEETTNDSTLCSFLCQNPGEQYVPAERRCRPASNATRFCRFYRRWPAAGSVAASHLPPLATTAAIAQLEVDLGEESGTIIVPINSTLSICFRCSRRRSFLAYELLDGGVLLANGSSYTPPYYVVDATRGVAIVCVPSERNDTFVGSMLPADGGDCEALPSWVTTVLLALSIVCLFLYLALCVSWRRLRHFPGDLVANEAFAFLSGFALFLFRPLAGDSSIGCYVLAVSIHYFLVAAFVWMMLYAIEIVRALSISAAQLADAASGELRQRRIAYYVIGWFAPLVVVGSALLADEFGAAARPAYGLPQCFINSLLGNRAFFIAPLCVVILVVIGVYGYMVIRLVVIARQTRDARRHGADAEKLMLAVKLLFALGPLWLLAMLSSFVDSPQIACAFVVLNASQGTFLLAAYACNAEARRIALRCWRRHYHRCSRGRRLLQIRSSATTSEGEPAPLSQAGEGTLTQLSLVNTSN